MALSVPTTSSRSRRHTLRLQAQRKRVGIDAGHLRAVGRTVAHNAVQCPAAVVVVFAQQSGARIALTRIAASRQARANGTELCSKRRFSSTLYEKSRAALS